MRNRAVEYEKSVQNAHFKSRGVTNMRNRAVELLTCAIYNTTLTNRRNMRAVLSNIRECRAARMTLWDCPAARMHMRARLYVEKGRKMRPFFLPRSTYAHARPPVLVSYAQAIQSRPGREG